MTSKSPYHPVLHDEFFVSLFSKKKIRVIAPASGISKKELECLRMLPSLKPFIPDDLLNPVVPYHSNTDEVRLAQLQSALYENPEEIIWCLRGGYGCARLIDELKNWPVPPYEKIFIGYSDITALHLFLSQKWGWRTIHGPGFAQLLSSSWNIENFIRVAKWVESPQATQTIPLVALNQSAEKGLHMTGRMNGGNLTLVENSLGTSWQIYTSGCILFLEEVGEKGYRVDRSLTHLRQAGLFENVQAVIFGEFLSDDKEVVAFALKRFAQEVGFPVFQSHAFGHGLTNYPIVYHSQGIINNLVLQIQVG